MVRQKRRLGVHTSIAGGLHCSVERARELGCSTMQIFSHNPRQWAAARPDAEDVSQFRRLRELHDINPVYVHTSYLINLAASNNDILEKSIQLLITEMDLADMLGADFVVLHTGSASQTPPDIARKKAVEALKTAMGSRRWQARLLLENTAGEKGDISSQMKDLAEILNGISTVVDAGLCIDTCHAFAAGYDLSDNEGLSQLIREIEAFSGIERVKLIHLNDSKKGYNSRVDRHDHIGNGGIGTEGLRRFVTHPLLKTVPLILETPKKTEEDDPTNLRTVKGLLKQL